ncbi:hypothetical protein [Hyalangium rubrum]|uniref:Zinc finger/thioredoxin putative domain-containing protein n=1 Tax=Hyalangium rubrum TaxID=3103134 RepID=A0ABU5HC82_9BACT|nr:hypothetical protein [Hyalangium sp. s54d21]MDY7230752.1 hypothetical protein [Hyalangium sp. s54d21]
MQLSCEVCHSPLRAEDVRLDLAVAKCHACNAVYDLSGRKARGLSAQRPEKLPLRPKVALPSNFRVEEDGPTTRISWRWFNPLTHLFLAFFCIAWDGFLVVWYGIALNMEDKPIIMILFPIAHVAVGVGLTYSTLTGFVNRTRIEVNRDQLTIRHGPLPWRGNQDLPGRQLTQLYGEEVARTNKGSTTYSYDLLALDREGRKVKLLSGLTEKDQVLYLEQTLERKLGIEDAAVDGELARRTHAA